MKFYGVTIQMKPLQQYFHMILFIQCVVLTFESVEEILWCYHSNETSLAIHLNSTVCFLWFSKMKFWTFCWVFCWSLWRNSLLCRGLFVLWGGWEERKRTCAGKPRALSIFSIIAIFIGIPSGISSAKERDQERNRWGKHCLDTR